MLCPTDIMYVLHNTCYTLQFLYELAQALQQKINNICYKQNRLTTFQQQAETKSSAGKVQFVFKFNLQNQSNWVVFFTSKQLNKGVGTQNKEGIQLFLWIGFLVTLWNTWHGYHKIKRHELLVCLIHGKLNVK